jgi:hypothetical protein
MRRSERAGPPGHGPQRRDRDGGFVTAEAAVVIPVLVGLAGLLLWGLMAAAAEIRCVDAARAGARAAARSENAADVLRVTRTEAPSGARVSVTRSAGFVRVSVTVPPPRFPFALKAEAAAWDEDDAEEEGT